MNIALIGYGKMGHAVATVIETEYMGLHRIACRIGSSNTGDKDVLTWEKLGNTSNAQLNGIDVAIEFSRPEAAVANLTRCLEWGVPVVCGTTGWLQHLSEITDLCQQHKGALLYAANFSLSVNIMLALNRQLAQLMRRFGNEYVLQIDEIHHVQKLDAPSGTAIALANGIMAVNPDKKRWVNTDSDATADIPILSHREADINGTHIVSYGSTVDMIALQHTAHSRQGFAKGAVSAAEWIMGKQGVFTMADVLQMPI